jgi:hypothetical protein
VYQQIRNLKATTGLEPKMSSRDENSRNTVGRRNSETGRYAMSAKKMEVVASNETGLGDTLRWYCRRRRPNVNPCCQRKFQSTKPIVSNFDPEPAISSQSNDCVTATSCEGGDVAIGRDGRGERLCSEKTKERTSAFFKVSPNTQAGRLLII